MIVLKQNLGEAGALIGDKSIGADTLRDVLVAMIQATVPVSGRQDTVATATIAGIVLNKPGKVTNLRTAVGTTGTAGATTVQVHLNGVSQGELTTDNTDADGTVKSLTLDVDCVAGDLVELVVSAAPTAGANLTASLTIEPVDVE